MIELQSPWFSQPPGPPSVNRKNPLGARVIEGFWGDSQSTVLGGKMLPNSAASLSTEEFGRGLASIAGAGGGWSLPSLDLSQYNGITLLFQYIQHSRSGTQVLLETSPNYNNNNGTFLVYTDSATNRLHFGTRANGAATYDASYITAPPVGLVTTIAVRLRFTGSAIASDDIGIWVNGHRPATTDTNNSSGAGNFGSHALFLWARNNASLFARGSAGLFAVLDGFLSDEEMASASANPWQIAEVVDTPLFFSQAAGGPSPDVTVAISGVSTAGQLGTIEITRTTALTGSATTGELGSAAETTSKDLSGTQATGQAGSVGELTSIALSGASAAGQVGTIATEIDGVAPPGEALATNDVLGAELLMYELAYEENSTDVTIPSLASVQASAAIGAAMASSAKEVSGAAAAGQSGAAKGSVFISLSGASATGQTGTVARSSTAGLTGAAAPGQTATLGTTKGQTLTGATSLASVGALLAQISRGANGVSATGQRGTVDPRQGVFRDLESVAATGLVRAPGIAVTVSLSGVASIGSVQTLDSLITVFSAYVATVPSLNRTAYAPSFSNRSVVPAMNNRSIVPYETEGVVEAP